MRSTLKVILLLSIVISSLGHTHRLLTIHEETDPSLKEKIKTLKPIVDTLTQSSGRINKSSSELKFKYYVFEEQCFDIFFNQKNFLHFECIKLTLSKLVGYALVYGSLLVKAPQILKIILNRSTVGISFSSVIIQSFMNALMIGYNIQRGNPFSIYGQNVFLGISNFLIIGCFFMFSRGKNLGKYIIQTILLLIISIPLILQLAPPIVIENSIWIGIVAFIISRFEQIRQNHKNKSTGNLSFLTAFLNFGGNIARTFTVLTEASGDTMYLISNILPIFVNGYIVLQFILYWNNKIVYEPVVDKSKDKEQSKKSKAKNSEKRL